jgi:hypothetical protein
MREVVCKIVADPLIITETNFIVLPSLTSSALMFTQSDMPSENDTFVVSRPTRSQQVLPSLDDGSRS